MTLTASTLIFLEFSHYGLCHPQSEYNRLCTCVHKINVHIAAIDYKLQQFPDRWYLRLPSPYLDDYVKIVLQFYLSLLGWTVQDFTREGKHRGIQAYKYAGGTL